MRLARLAAVGLAIGVIAGFAIALLRPRPQVRPGTNPQSPAAPVRGDKDSVLWAQFKQAERDERSQSPEGSAVLDIRTGRRVTG